MTVGHLQMPNGREVLVLRGWKYLVFERQAGREWEPASLKVLETELSGSRVSGFWF